MGRLIFWKGDHASDPVIDEYDSLVERLTDQTVFLLAHLSNVARAGVAESEGDDIPGEATLLGFSRGRACVIFRVMPADTGADVLVLVFGDTKHESFEILLNRAKSRDP